MLAPSSLSIDWWVSIERDISSHLTKSNTICWRANRLNYKISRIRVLNQPEKKSFSFFSLHITVASRIYRQKSECNKTRAREGREKKRRRTLLITQQVCVCVCVLIHSEKTQSSFEKCTRHALQPSICGDGWRWSVIVVLLSLLWCNKMKTTERTNSRKGKNTTRTQSPKNRK